MAQNPFDKFDAVQGNPFDQFENTPTPTVPVAPNRYPEDIRRSMSQYIRPGLEYGGMMGGSMAAGGPLTPTGIAGAGLGYAGGNLAANYIDEKMGLRQPPDMLGRVQQTGQAATEGALMEMGGGIAGNLLQRGGAAVANSGLPEWLYSKAMRTPMTEAWKRTIPTKDWTKREQALAIGMEEGIKPNALGKQQVVNRIREIDGEVRRIIEEKTIQSEAIKQASAVPQSTTGNPIQRGWENFNGVQPAPTGYDTKVSELADSLNPLKAKARMARDSGTAGGAIGEIEAAVRAKGGVRGVLNPSELQMLKQEYYKDIDFDLTKKVVNENGRFTTEATKAVAAKAMDILQNRIAPELQYLNPKEASYIMLRQSIEHTLARYENTNAVGLGAKMMSVRNVGLAALEVVTGTPSFKASLALALKKAGTKAPAVIGRPVAIYGNQEND
jgi:hypothetical protein